MSHEPSIYLNHAGTSWPKPAGVHRAMGELMAGDATQWPDRFAQARREILDFFHIEDASRLLLTPGCTSALSIAVSDQAWFQGDAVLTSSMEHHALHRPLFKLTELGVDLEVIPRSPTEPVILEEMENRLRRGGVKLVAVSAASNVTGELLPVEDIIALAHDHGALVLVDAAQTAGWWDLNVPAFGADLVCFAGHKGPHAPWGIGGLFVAKEVCLNSLSSQCEVSGESADESWHGCSPMPTYCDAGSADLAAMVGMAAATHWLKEPAQANRLDTARELSQLLYEGLAGMDGITVYGPPQPELRMPTVAFSHRQKTPSELGRALWARGVISSYGLQCSPLAHRNLGTGPFGLVRLSCGPTNSRAEIEKTLGFIEEIVRQG